MSDTYCAAAWRHVQLRTNDIYTPCCAWSHDHGGFTDKAEDPINHPWMQALRTRMLAGYAIDGCQHCYTHERLVGRSLRLDFNEQYGYVQDARLDYVEINFGNLCNLTCRMCNPHQSSKWIGIAKRMNNGHVSAKYVDRNLSDINIDWRQLSKIKFIGGEPAMQQDKIRAILIDIIDYHGSLEHLDIEIITNGTIALDDDIISMFLSCRHVLMQISIDGLEDRNQYQRHGSDWDQVVSTAKLYDQNASVKWSNYISATISLFTVDGACDFHDWMRDALPNTKMITNIVTDPDELNPRNLPEDHKANLINDLMQWQAPLTDSNARNHRDLIVSFLKQAPTCTLPQVIDKIRRLDDAMDTSLEKALPKLYRTLFAQ